MALNIKVEINFAIKHTAIPVYQTRQHTQHFIWFVNPGDLFHCKSATVPWRQCIQFLSFRLDIILIKCLQGLKYNNKLATLEATLVETTTDWLTDSLTGVKCRATSVAKKSLFVSNVAVSDHHPLLNKGRYGVARAARSWTTIFWSFVSSKIVILKGGFCKKHRKNCECCPVSHLIVRWRRLSWNQFCNCKNCN